MSLTVLTYWWTPETDKYFAFKADDVRFLKRMVKQHLPVPHEFAVITDHPEAFDSDSDIRAIPIDWTTHVHNRCYVRLMTFHPKGREIIGERVLQMDLDVLVVGDMTPIVERDEDLVLWHNPARAPWERPQGKGAARPFYNTSMVMHRCGSMPTIWSDFDPKDPMWKDDQWLLSYKLGPNIPYWDGKRDGVYRLARPNEPETGVNGDLPDNARIVFFPGSNGKPWHKEVNAKNPWIRDRLPPDMRARIPA